ncbi:MAG: response regulator [Deltaproteobacteria bacterium]|nr:response regulator [Deltaproteobacteria bacterium]
MGKIHLLIVDDDSTTREMMAAFFKEKGYFVFLAENGEEDLYLLGEKKIDLVISDYQMPGMDGRELVRRINKFHPSLPVILITGRSFSKGTDASFLRHLYGFFPKPVDLMLLEISIAKAVGNACLG